MWFYLCLSQIIGDGMAGIQGPLYIGTGCFHRRKLIYGFSLDNNADVQGKEGDGKVLKESLGSSTEFLNSVTQILKDDSSPVQDLSSAAVQLSSQVARCDYEHGTSWGTKVGWGYASVTEDILTGMRIHREGWSSVWCGANPPGFLGTVPTSLPVCLLQKKRWATGLLQVFFSKNNPLFDTLYAKLGFRQSLAYIWILNWGLGSIFDLCYSLLPTYCILTNSNFLPKAYEPAMVLLVARLLIQHLQSLRFNLQCGLSVRVWWNGLRIAKIYSATSFLFGFLCFLLKFVGISEVTFEVTRKDQPDFCDDQDSDDRKDHDVSKNNVGRFTFDESPMFIPGTIFLFVHLTALALSLFGHEHDKVGVGEYFYSVLMVLCFWPFVRGLFGKGKYGIPSSVVLKAAGFAFIFVHLCRASASVF